VGPDLIATAGEGLRSPAVLSALELLWLLGISGWLLLERRSPAATLAWILALAALPVVGIPVYLLLGPRRLERKKVRMAMARRARSLHLSAWERPEPPCSPFGEQLARLATRLDVAPPETATAVAFHVEGDAAYDAMVEAIASARQHVHAEFYIFRPDGVGARIRDALAERARAGVEVRLLLDAAGSSSTGTGFLAPLVAAGGAVQRFNPLRFGRLRRPFPNFRTHRKILVVDGSVGFTGGMNVADDQSRAARGDGAWRDTQVRIDGAAVHGLQLTFLEDWAFATGRDPAGAGGLSNERLRAYFPALAPGPHAVQVVASGPDQPDTAIESLYFAAIAGARQRVWITTPYFVPTEPTLEALTTAALRGVDVQLILPVRTDSPLTDAAGTTYHDALLEAGAQVHLHGPPMVHAKTCVVDDVLAIVGTANFDNRSFRLNFEVVAAFYGGEPVAEVARHFEADRARTRRLSRREERGPLGRRLFASLARLLAPQL
jgi:cardiolipin synthase